MGIDRGSAQPLLCLLFTFSLISGSCGCSIVIRGYPPRCEFYYIFGGCLGREILVNQEGLARRSLGKGAHKPKVAFPNACVAADELALSSNRRVLENNTARQPGDF